MTNTDRNTTDEIPEHLRSQDAYLAWLGQGPVELGSILFTMTEPSPGWEVAYNRWYERDHFYAGCMVGPNNFAGKRWVAPRRYKDLRHLGDDRVAKDALDGSYVSLYWVLEGKRQEWNRWAYREFKDLHANGRMFPHREHVHTLLYDADWTHHRDADPVPTALALDHAYAGLVVTIGEATTSRAELDAWVREEHLPSLGADTAIAQTVCFSGVPLLVDAEGVAKDEGSEQRFLHLAFLDRDPADVWDATYAGQPAAMEAAGVGRVSWQGPFIPTIVGTDAYTDDLR